MVPVTAHRNLHAIRQHGSDRPCRTAHHSRTGCHIACDDRACANDGTVPYGYARQKDRAATYPHLLADAHRQRALQTTASLIKRVGMVGAVDLYCGSQHRPTSDPDGRGIKDDTIRVDIHPVAQHEIPAIGNVKGRLKENALTDGSEKRRKLWRARTTQRRVHGGVTPASLSCGIAQRLELGRHAGIPSPVGHFGQRCGRRMGGYHVRRHLAVKPDIAGQVSIEQIVAEADRRRYKFLGSAAARWSCPIVALATFCLASMRLKTPFAP